MMPAGGQNAPQVWTEKKQKTFLDKVEKVNSGYNNFLLHGERCVTIEDTPWIRNGT